VYLNVTNVKKNVEKLKYRHKEKYKSVLDAFYTLTNEMAIIIPLQVLLFV